MYHITNVIEFDLTTWNMIEFDLTTRNMIEFDLTTRNMIELDLPLWGWKQLSIIKDKWCMKKRLLKRIVRMES